jgi:predicted DNA-binding transcriptional regulator AlpA
MTEYAHNVSMMRTVNAASFVGLSASTLTKLRLTGGGPIYLKLGKTVVYDPSDLKNWLESKRRRSTAVI